MIVRSRQHLVTLSPPHLVRLTNRFNNSCCDPLCVQQPPALGVPHLVGGAELGACPGTWPKIINIADEHRPFIEGEFKLAMNRAENCPPLSAEQRAKLGFTGAPPGSAGLHFNDVDRPTGTRLGLFQFMWAGLRIADLKDPRKPVEVAYFKPGDFCTGHVRYVPKTGQIWAVCGQSGFYVLELTPAARLALR